MVFYLILSDTKNAGPVLSVTTDYRVYSEMRATAAWGYRDLWIYPESLRHVPGRDAATRRANKAIAESYGREISRFKAAAGDLWETIPARARAMAERAAR